MEHKDKTFGDEAVMLDNSSFIRCHFDGSNLIYSGSGPVNLSECAFKNVKWTFSGNASNTLKFMQGLYHGAGVNGKKLIEETFNQIRFSDFEHASV
jgi:hypothetical protein